MTDKILVWVDVGLIQFAVSKNLQNMHDCELFAIYDLNHHIKKSFVNQKLVNYKKEWFYWDHVLNINDNPDVNYLKSFEDRYKINLWEITLSDRVFYKYNQFYKFKKNEILSILEQECRFFEKVLDEVNPDFLIIKTTDFHRSHLLEKMCKSKGTKVLMLETSRLGFRSVISNEANEIDYLENMEKTNYEITFPELRKNLKKFDRYEQAKTLSGGGFNFSLWGKFKVSLIWMIKTFDKEYKMGYDHFGLTRFNAITDRLSAFVKRVYRTRYVDMNLKQKISNEKFVYLPLSVEPERTLSISAPFHMNQLEIIKNLAKSLPVDYKLYVKEHMGMRYRHWRPISYYKEIMNLPNVTLIHPSLSSKELLKNCSIVCTVTGSAGLEAAYYEKPSIIFGHTSYDSLPSVHRIKNLEDLPTIIRTCLNQKVNPSDVANLVNIIENISFDLDLINLENRIKDSFHAGGFLISNSININFLDSFLEKNKAIFEMLTNEHIKKIKQHKTFRK